MVLKEKYIKSAKLNNLSGTLIFFSNNKSEIKNIIRNTGSSNDWINNILDDNGSTYSEDII